MRATRSSSRVPLQTISTHNSEKTKKDSDTKGRAPIKQENTGANTGTEITKQKSRFTDLRVGSRLDSDDDVKPAELMNDLKPEVGTRQLPENNKGVEVESRSCAIAEDSGHGSSCDSTPKKRRKRTSSPSDVEQVTKRLKEEKESEDEELSESEEELDYEQLRERNMRDNEAFFSSLGIEKAKEHLRLSARKIPKPSVKREPRKKEVLPRRKSLRIQRIDPTGQPLPPEPEPEPFVVEHPRIPTGPVKMVDVMENEEEDHAITIHAWSDLTKDKCQHKPLSAELAGFVSEMKKMRITTKAKACKDRLFSVAVHPTTSRVLAMAGDKWGRLGFWDLSAADQDKSVVTYRPHSRPIGNIMVPADDPLKVYTCSYDSTLRCGHVERGIFEELYSVPEEEDDLFRNFDFLSPSSLLLAQFRGDVAVLDTRSPGQKAEQVYRVCDKYLRTVSVHPTDPNFFITAGTDMKVSVWDLRKLGKKGNKPLHSLTHGRAVSSAYFSPLTGGRILSCSADDTLNVFNCSSSCGEVTRAKTLSHNNKTGRWLTPFRSVWHPAREDVFFVGSMKSPRRMEAFGVDGRLLHEFQGDLLASVCSVVQFHPSCNILVGGNSSGYIFPFM